MFPEFPAFFQAFSQLVSRLCSIFNKISLEVTCFGSPGRRNISELCLFWNYHGYSILYFTACLPLVKVNTAYVFLGRDLLVPESESQEDQYMFEICLVEHCAHNCHQISISSVSSFSKPVYSLSQIEVLKFCCI